MSLRKALIRLAHSKPELRGVLLPLLKTAEQAQWAQYKGRKYKLMFLGPTKYGERAHLQFADGSKDFWVDAHQVQTEKAPPQSCSIPKRRDPHRKYECEECGDYVYPGTQCWETGCIH